jgi:transposase-like protein
METTGSSFADQSGHWSAQAKTSVVLTVLTQQASAAQAAAANGVAEAQVAAWVNAFVEAGEHGLRGRGGPAAAARIGLAEENRMLRAVLRKTRGRARMWQVAAGDTLGPFATLR